MTEPTQTTEHPWATKMRQKLRERGFVGDRLEREMRRMFIRFPFLRGDVKSDPHAGLHRAINISKGAKNDR